MTGDGDFLCLVEYLIEQAKLKALLIPNRQKWSSLFKIKSVDPFIRQVEDLRKKLEHKQKRALIKTELHKGHLSFVNIYNYSKMKYNRQ